MDEEAVFRSGFVGIVGRPNVGKSTLLNNLAHQKVAIISNKPQTTRNRIRCIVNTDQAQVIFIDTPGFHKPKNALGERLNKQVKETFSDVDVILLMLDGTQTIGRGDLYIAGELSDLKTPVVVILNKIDKLSGEQVEAQMSVAENLGDFRKVIPVSARTGENVHAIIGGIAGMMPEGPRYYPDDVVTDQPASFIVAELIREKIIRLTQEEVPHSVAVQVEEMGKREDSDIMDIRAAVYVERDSQKGIIIGKGGRMLREVGSKARAEIEPLLGEHVFLELHVKVEKDWTRRPGSITRLMEDL